ncbi:hypothetical protein [Archangium lansingense]|uniref:Uncharacterized protein n=1 Tax=Archangium lansingense TaxID=2995310 RepID=A0ABT4AC43_9BACT|nr:hypothetical protein [Archangium lansinium]MCY1079151.1 hypothetical protein [Archangium lansinium]
MNVHPGMARNLGPMQPLSPSDFHDLGPGGPTQTPALPLQWGGPGAQERASLSPQEKAVLRHMVDILKQGREPMASGMLDELDLQRLTAAHAYISGFLEARGLGELGAFLGTIPPPSGSTAGT